MTSIRSITARFPQYELMIRRRCALDEQFRAICMDYAVATAALDYWKAASKAGDPKIEEYSAFLAELEAEILEQLDHA